MLDGQLVDTFGDVAAMSMMFAKSLAIGESGMLIIDDRAISDRAVAFTYYFRHQDDLELGHIVSFRPIVNRT